MTLSNPVDDSFRRQADACRDLGSAFNALVCDLLRERLEPVGAFGHRIRLWPGDPVADALALRACGALHALARSGDCPALRSVYPSANGDSEAVWGGVQVAIHDHDGFLAAYLDSPPQTNEVSRSSSILGGCLTVAEASGMPIEVYEIGSSAGLNLGFDRWRYDFGGRSWGD